ncbi:hypothetical protein PTSG_07297 [Salpingoeca rosetta]|uniref:protein-tyrosine-phosphatase n=1 Tax=Salpingoeca rosetta (strain ATCC 50818 / BSB-021) TaxID=946362 RepID=F2UJ08_SALR5|nr:uncharacterized protein PTSG_07297 [Salpingoeca rosetta]EGD76956.1 hypothetical protein PTSG_07297 [Salpingoeca rosetta]|eukprot:XP_004990796.1 hypothetical protein PTSG_07297 [Salpingoeca rosetta]
MSFQELLARQRQRASELRPYLYVGSAREASDLEYLQMHGFTHILNVANDVPNYHTQHFTYCHLPVADFGQDEGISRIFAQAKAFVEEARAASTATTEGDGKGEEAGEDADDDKGDDDTADDGEASGNNGDGSDNTGGVADAGDVRQPSGARRSQAKVLVHCAAGCNRSVTVCVALLMMLENMTLREAFAHVKKQRPGVWPMKDNRQQLLAFERKLTGTNTITEEQFSGNPRKLSWLRGMLS